MGNDPQDAGRISVGKSFLEVDNTNYKEITERLVKLERVLTGKADSYNVPPLPPIGSVVPWCKSLSGVPQTLPDNWVECDGQTLDDAGSPMDGQVIPNLNGDGGGASISGITGTPGVFLRGGTSSGTGTDDEMQGHRHNLRYDSTDIALLDVRDNSTGAFGGFRDGGGGSKLVDLGVGDPKTDGTNGTPRTGTETKPVNYTVVWVMRIK